MRTQTKTKKTAQFNLRENAEDKIIIVISFACDWLRRWCKVYEKSRCRVKQKYTIPDWIFDTQLL